MVLTSITASFVLFMRFVNREGSRFGCAHAEITLASDIHRLLVPPIVRRIGRFDFVGVSLRSGAVGGDLVDVVESNGRGMGYVADVSGHGVGAGLLMGMVKSAARMQLLSPQPLDRLLTDLNVVLLELKRPEMFVTFAALQFDGDSALQFATAGHLPILRCQVSALTVDELSTPQVPLAMFEDRTFAASRIAAQPGDLFVILTDGLTEVFDAQDREFGLDGVKALVRENANAPLDTLREILLGAVRQHGPQLDDQTLLLIGVVG
jgi:sigma-B regulation protein RsbU (phosphoserine phosphatase)